MSWFSPEPSPYPVGKRVIVHLLAASTIRGTIAEAGQLLTLAQAELIRERGEPVPIDGTVLVRPENVDFVQVLP